MVEDGKSQHKITIKQGLDLHKSISKHHPEDSFAFDTWIYHVEEERNTWL